MPASDFKEISAAQFFSITGGLIAGVILALLENELLIVPGLLILIPGFLEMRGNIAGSMAARLSSALHMGHIKPKVKNSPFLKENVLAAFTLVLIISLTLGLISFLATYIYFKVFYVKIIYIAVISAVISNLISIPSTVVVCFWIFRKGYDPDNIMGPYVTTTGDVISMLSLFLTIMVLI
ncbi:magnesium transporter [candidate division KSB1 bacterium]